MGNTKGMKYGYVATLGLAAFVTGALMNLDPRSVEAYVTSITSRIEKFFLYNPAKRNLKLGDMLMEKVLGAMEARDKSREWMYLDSDTIDNVSSAILYYQEARRIIDGHKKPKNGDWADGCTPEMDEDEKDIRAHFYYGIGIGKKILGNNARFENNDV